MEPTSWYLGHLATEIDTISPLQIDHIVGLSVDVYHHYKNPYQRMSAQDLEISKSILLLITEGKVLVWTSPEAPVDMLAIKLDSGEILCTSFCIEQPSIR